MDSVSVTSEADIKNTVEREDNLTGFAIVSFGTLSITGGTVSSISTYAVLNSKPSSVSISGGIISGGVYNNDGSVNITGGTVEKTSIVNSLSGAVYNDYEGIVNIAGGTVENTGTDAAVWVNSNCPVSITGGTVSATTGIAVIYTGCSTITVSGTAKVTSANTDTKSGTIYLEASLGTNRAKLVITGGTVENTSVGTGNAIYNHANLNSMYYNSPCKVNITGGTVSKAGNGNYAVYNVNTNKGDVVTIEPGATIVGNKYGCN